MRHLSLVLLFLSACATAPKPSAVPDYGSGGPGPRGASLVSLLEGQAMAPTSSPSSSSSAYSLTLYAPNNTNAVKLNNNGARVDLGSGASDYFASDGTNILAAGTVKSTVTGVSFIASGGGVPYAFGTGAGTEGQLVLNNGTYDGPEVKWVYGANLNFAIDGYSATTPQLRLLHKAGETGGALILNFRPDGTTQFSGVATASLMTCNAALAGSIQYDTTTSQMKLCNGSAWTNLTPQVGSITLAAGSGTATVKSGATCTCTDTTANASVKCSVATTTLTATGTATDVIAFTCF